MFGPSLWVVLSPNKYHTPSPFDAGASEAPKAFRAPGPIEVNTAAFSPVTQRSARGRMRSFGLVTHGESTHYASRFINAQHLADLRRAVAKETHTFCRNSPNTIASESVILSILRQTARSQGWLDCLGECHCLGDGQCGLRPINVEMACSCIWDRFTP